jgi:hypothetical protein
MQKLTFDIQLITELAHRMTHHIYTYEIMPMRLFCSNRSVRNNCMLVIWMAAEQLLVIWRAQPYQAV